MTWRRVHLCTGILIRHDDILLVENRYPNLIETVWNLPGGRQDAPESIAAAVVREFAEETALAVRVERLAYVAESYDRVTCTHFTNFAFYVSGAGEARVPAGDAHTVACRWVAIASLADVISVAVVREPLVQHLADPSRQYFPYAEAGITIEFAD